MPLIERHDAADVLVLPAGGRGLPARAQRRVVGAARDGHAEHLETVRIPKRKWMPLAIGSIVGVVGTVTSPVNLRVSSDPGVLTRLSRMAGFTIEMPVKAQASQTLPRAVAVVVDERRIGRVGAVVLRFVAESVRVDAGLDHVGGAVGRRRHRSPRCRKVVRDRTARDRARLAIVGAADAVGAVVAEVVDVAEARRAAAHHGAGQHLVGGQGLLDAVAEVRGVAVAGDRTAELGGRRDVRRRTRGRCRRSSRPRRRGRSPGGRGGEPAGTTLSAPQKRLTPSQRSSASQIVARGGRRGWR